MSKLVVLEQAADGSRWTVFMVEPGRSIVIGRNIRSTPEARELAARNAATAGATVREVRPYGVR